jgi:pyrroloquinoline quinone (PQQ) biosynthesis protein C
LKIDRSAVLRIYDQFPFHRHPFWRGVLEGRFQRSEIVLGEVQHYIRSNIGRHFRKRAADEAKAISLKAHALLYETYREECTDECGPSHVDLIKRFLLVEDVSEEHLGSAKTTPGNAAAIALYKDITDRGPLHHMIGAGTVEYYYSELSPQIFEAYTNRYGFSASQAETYAIHGPMDREHAERALSILDEPYVQANGDAILHAVRDAFVATNLHYDGMYQAAIGKLAYWSGE